jgi:hypothetical protein
MNENVIPSIPRSETSDVLDIIIPRVLDAKFMTRLEADRDAMRGTPEYDHLAILKAVFRVPDDGPDV